MPNRLIILGSTGSIGQNTLAVVEHLNRTGHRKLEVVGLAARSSAKSLLDQAQATGCKTLALTETPTHGDAERSESSGIRLHTGPTAATDLVNAVEADIVVAAIVGIAGLRSALAAIDLGRTVALANKETLVAAGPLVMPKVREKGVALLPIDSEHSAVWQCLGMDDGNQTTSSISHPPTSIRRIVLTASGGPFRTASADDIASATPEQALRHPTWSMGPKNTIDSATLMNKALEVIEAHWLFDLPIDRIEVLVHPQSFIHGLVEFADRSVIAQMGPPDMRTPIHVALCFPDRVPGCGDPLDLYALSRLDFEPPDYDRFPALTLPRRVIEQGGTSGAIMNAANEAAVEAFLNRRIKLGRITELVIDTLDALPPQPINDLDDVYDADRKAREHVKQKLSTTSAVTNAIPEARVQ